MVGDRPIHRVPKLARPLFHFVLVLAFR